MTRFDDSSPDRRTSADRRSGIDTRNPVERALMGERRSGGDRRLEGKAAREIVAPSHEHLALFARRLRRALGNEKARDAFGVTRGEGDFSVHPDVLRTIEWIESLVAANEQASLQAKPPDKISIRKQRQQDEAKPDESGS
jgi:hypothetical protein